MKGKSLPIERTIRKMKHNDKWYFIVKDIIQVFVGNIANEEMLDQVKQLLWQHHLEITMGDNHHVQFVECIDKDNAIAIIESIPVFYDTIIKTEVVDTLP